MTVNHVYYISTGEQTKMYTLRHTYTERVSWGGYGGQPNSRMVRRNYYVQNLSTNKEKAIEKAREITGETLEIRFELNPIYRKGRGENTNPIDRVHTEHDVIPFGKHYGTSLQDLFEMERDYLVWVAENFTSTKYNSIIEFIRTMVKDVIAEKEAKISEEEKKEAAAKSNRAKILAPLVVALRGKESSNFCQSMADDMEKGSLPRGRGWNLVCDIVAKMQGRRNSKKYKETYARVEEVLNRAEKVDSHFNSNLFEV